MNLLRVAPLLLSAAGLWGCAGQGGPARYYRQRESPKFPLVTPLLHIDDTMDFKELRSVREDVADLARRRVAAGDGVEAVAVYFRDLNLGPWFGVNEKEPFIPASLLKVPIMMVLFKKAEEEAPELLKMRITSDIDYSKDTDQGLERDQQVQPGKTYTIEELVALMVVHSDNRAHELLLDFLDRGDFKHLFEDLSLPPPDIRGQESYLSARNYATFFRILYNASYLSRSASNRVLELLSRSSYEEGLVAGLPPGTKVAHKFGIRTYDDKPDLHLHDCGIVYRPGMPYLLCVMTRGRSRPAQADVIRSIAALVYGAAVERGGRKEARP